jgi:hypothetical protein
MYAISMHYFINEKHCAMACCETFALAMLHFGGARQDKTRFAPDREKDTLAN